ncbi:MAG: LD-carboxypeptidase [Chlorobia bacterium]|nr:LD-carboxypeptidase [Fimbriimonadaceae bacterium]
MDRTDAPIRPPALKPGDTIRMVTPASPLLPEKTDFMRSLLEEEGYRVEFSKHCFDADCHLAGSDQDRASDLMGAFLDPAVHAVLCSRGGYGCARLFPYLDLDAIVAAKKLFVGFSDITTLHIALNSRGLATVHAPMALTLVSPREPWVYESLKSALKGENPIPAAAPTGQTLVAGQAEGIVVGGCLILMCDSLGTQNPIDAKGRILIIEDVDEDPHRIDAMFTHMLNAGITQKASGIVVGEMTRTDERKDDGIGGKPWREIVRERLMPLNIPTILDYPFGHNKNMLSLPLGVRARLNADAGTLEYLEGHCA